MIVEPARSQTCDDRHPTSGGPLPSPTLVAGAPCWIDIYSSDTRKATEFYSQLFGWTAEERPERFGGYFTFTEGRKAHRRLHAKRRDGICPRLDRLPDDRRHRAPSRLRPPNGGQIDLRRWRSPTTAAWRCFADPGQASVGVWQPGTQKGFEVTGRSAPRLVRAPHPGLRRPVRSTAIFKWDTHVAARPPEFRYTTLGEGESILAGIMDASAFLPEGFRHRGRSTSALRHGRGAADDRRARREGHSARRGHAVRPPRAGRRPDRDAVQAPVADA